MSSKVDRKEATRVVGTSEIKPTWQTLNWFLEFLHTIRLSFDYLTVSTNKVKMFEGRNAPWTVTSRVANSLFWGVSLVVPVSALIRDVFPQLVYPMTATLACLIRLLCKRKNSRCFAILSISLLIRRSLLKLEQIVKASHTFWGSNKINKNYLFNMNLWRSK